MNAKSIGLMALAAAALAGGYYAFESGSSSSAAGIEKKALLPALEGAINDVVALRVDGAEGAFTVRREDDGTWGMEEKRGYPVDLQKVRGILIGMSAATILEAKTSNPELYGRLGVQDPGTEEAESTRVTALNAADEEVASLIVGDRRWAKGAARTPGTSEETYFVRRSGEDQAWLAEGNLQVEGDEGQWLEREILDVARERIRSVRIEHADGEVVRVSKESEDETNFALADIPEGKQLSYASAPNTLGSALARLTMDDVVPSADVVFDDPPLSRCTFETFDGLTVVVTIHEAKTEEDGEEKELLYARFDASFVPPPEEPEEAEEPEPEPDPVPEGEEPAEPDAEPEEDEGPSAEEVQEQVTKILATTESWTYVLPSWKKSSFVKRASEMLKDVEPPPGDAAEPNAVEPGDEAPADAGEAPVTVEGATDEGAGDASETEAGTGEAEGGETPPPDAEGAEEPEKKDDGGGAGSGEGERKEGDEEQPEEPQEKGDGDSRAL